LGEVTGWISDGAIGSFHSQSFRALYGPEIDSASKGAYTPTESSQVESSPVRLLSPWGCTPTESSLIRSTPVPVVFLNNL